jgi:hypothetical protein
MMGDIGSPNDLDGDGVMNGDDNCPNHSNPDQNDEDSNSQGDPCDPCPPYETYYDYFTMTTKDADADTDTDGVGDGCDPDPETPGNHILRFAGFKTAPPPPAMVQQLGNGTSTFNGRLVVTSGAIGDGVQVYWPAPPEVRARETWTYLTLTSKPFQSTGAGAVDWMDPNTSTGVGCEMWGANSTTMVQAILYLPVNVASMGSGLAVGSWLMKLRHNASSTFFSCAYFLNPTNYGTLTNINAGSQPALPAGAVIGVRATTTSTFDWMMVVD